MDRARVRIEKLVHGGQGLGVLPDGRKVFVWNALPDETVDLQIIRSRKDYAEAVATEVIVKSKERAEPKEENYLSTSPWQILKYDAENAHKAAIVKETFNREHIDVGDTSLRHTAKEWAYRNKMEYSFWGDDDGLHLALHKRGSRGKQVVTGSALAISAIDQAANIVLESLKRHKIRAGDLKTLVLRCNQHNKVAASLYVKQEAFPRLELPEGLQGMRVYFSNPKSPASVRTKLLYEFGQSKLIDRLLGKEFTYDTDSFFQVNLSIYEQALDNIRSYVNSGGLLIDMYGGVGSIGLSSGAKEVLIIEADDMTAKMAQENANGRAQVICMPAEKTLDLITADSQLVVDPPRAGLNPKLIAKILEVLPSTVIYLSCNPATHARDIRLLGDRYAISHFEAYNFFPKTPHIETLAILQQR